MRKSIELNCNFCKKITMMKITGPIKNLGAYWVKCPRCNNNWRIPIDELERLLKRAFI
jgi:hypothetical protein